MRKNYLYILLFILSLSVNQLKAQIKEGFNPSNLMLILGGSDNDILNLFEEKDRSLVQKKKTKYAFLFSSALLLISVFTVISYVGKRKSNKALATKNKKIKVALDQVHIVQKKLIQSKKMTSLSMVPAEMAHEINNPMIFVFTDANILKAELNQVIANLITNAIAAITHANGRINISTKLHDLNCLIEISDNGNGIRKENVGRIFDPFLTTEEIGKGTSFIIETPTNYNI